MSWRGYTAALLLMNALHFALLYAILRLQFYLPFNPQHTAGMTPSLAFSTAASFVTNTNWQAYTPESGISNGAQMLGLTVHNFLSAATGIAVAVAVMRALAAGGLQTLGNFWADLTRATLYILLPLGCVFAVLLMASGVPDTLRAFPIVTTLEGVRQTIAIGPVAFQEAIKELGTNGGGFFNANSAHPFENPTALTCALEAFMLLLIPFALPVAFGRITQGAGAGPGAAGGHGRHPGDRRVLRLRGRGRRQPDPARARRRPGAGQPRGQGGALRHRAHRAAERRRHRHLDRCRGRRGRELHAAGRPGARCS